MSIGVLALVYAAFAPVRMRAGELLAGAGAAAILLALMRPLFGLLLQYNPNYGYAFGSLKAIFLLLVWIYYTFAVLVLGAEVLANVRRREALLVRDYLSGAGPSRLAAQLAGRFVRQVAAGEVLFREGDAGHEMFYVLGGTAEVRKGERTIGEMGEGGYFGEMSMLLGAPRTATVVAGPSGLRLLAVSQENFETVLRENPRIVESILREMARRLRATTDGVGRLK